jgi:hypothetical protein
VERCEEERGRALIVDDYAALVVGTERGAAEKVLAALDLPVQAELRVTRVWLAKLIGDTSLRKEANARIARARETR